MSSLRHEYDVFVCTGNGNIADMLCRAIKIIEILNNNLFAERAFNEQLLHEINSLRDQLEELLKRESS